MEIIIARMHTTAIIFVKFIDLPCETSIELSETRFTRIGLPVFCDFAIADLSRFSSRSRFASSRSSLVLSRLVIRRSTRITMNIIVERA